MSEKKAHNDELIFTQSSSVQEREKIKELWKFLDAQCDLQPYRPFQSTSKPSSQSSTRKKFSKKSKKSISEAKTSLQSTSSNENDISDRERIWYHGLRFFRQIGLDKAALSEDKCKFCLAEKSFLDTNYDDTISQTYDELKAEMASFDERLADHEIETSNYSQN